MRKWGSGCIVQRDLFVFILGCNAAAGVPFRRV